MMLTVMFYSTWYKFLLGGPMAPLKIDDAEFCFDNWWANLLLVHNLVNRTYKVCIPNSYEFFTLGSQKVCTMYRSWST